MKSVFFSLRLALALTLLSCTETTAPDTTVATVSVSIPRPMVRVGESIQATAKALNAGGGALSVTNVTWSSSDVSIATISSTGLVTALAPGDVTLQATTDGKVGVASLKITIVPVSSITISSATSTVSVGQIISLSAIAKDSAGNTLSGRSITWTTSDQTLAIVSQSGIVVGIAAGSVDVTASAEGKSTSTRINVTLPLPNTVASVSVSIPRTAFRVGETLQAAALPLDASGGVLTGRTITWSSSNTDIAIVSSSGLVTAVGPGIATISADVEGKTGTAVLQLSLVPVASITITPPSESISAGASVGFTAVLKDSADRVITGRTVTWTSSSPSIATVSAEGVVTAALIGTTQITASAEGKQATAAVTVNTVNTAVATVTVTPANANMSGGGTKQLTATLRDVNGNVLSGRNITWTSSNPDRATVSSTGLVTASPVDAPVVITATVEGKSATSSIGIITFVRMSAGSGFSCGLSTDGTAYCWGRNLQGQLGDGTTVNKLTPTKIATDVKFASISSGVATTCGIATTGATYCWGANNSGQVGNGTSSNNVLAPALVGGGYIFLSVAPASSNTCATTSSREVYCWGNITYRDNLPPDGHTNQIAQSMPMLIGTGMVAVVAGQDNRFCTVDPAGLAYCWSLAFNYSPSTGVSPAPLPGPVSTSLSFTTLRMGYGHVCGLVSSGQAYCWGDNSLGQLGDGTTTTRTEPTAVVGGLLFESLAAGASFSTWDYDYNQAIGSFTCAVTTAGKAYCWGSGIRGQLGIGDNPARATTPQPVAGGISFTGLRAGAMHVCGLAVGGAAYCWGTYSTFDYGGIMPSVRPTPLFAP